MSAYQDYTEALRDQRAPTLFLDLNAWEKNIAWVRAHAGNKKIRVATKSLRSLALIKKILAQGQPFQGLMTFTLEESLWLRDRGFDDILIGYPSLDLAGLKKLSLNPAGITLMVDRVEHLEAIDLALKGSATVVDVCVDLDLSMDLPGVRFGVYRSELKTPARLQAFLRELTRRKNIRLVGAMGYEAQIAGVMDTSKLIRGLKKLSLLQLKERRKNMLKVIDEFGIKLTLVNGGGSGSLQETAKEDVVTEVTIGSAFYAPTQFDQYDSLQLTPALFFSTQVLRAPEPGIVTVLGGGYIASGSVGEIKQPKPWLPEGLTLMKNEGAGEVQTPLILGDHDLKVGDLVIMRHAKAGEVCERFNDIHLVRSGRIEETVKTYRGEGQAFL